MGVLSVFLICAGDNWIRQKDCNCCNSHSPSIDAAFSSLNDFFSLLWITSSLALAFFFLICFLWVTSINRSLCVYYCSQQVNHSENWNNGFTTPMSMYLITCKKAMLIQAPKRLSLGNNVPCKKISCNGRIDVKY